MLFSCIKGPVDDPANNSLKPLSLTAKSAGIYTQTTDVEGEVNGLMTYDRKVMKLDEARLRETNLQVRAALNL